MIKQWAAFIRPATSVQFPQEDGSVAVVAQVASPVLGVFSTHATGTSGDGQLDGSDPDQSGWTFGH